MTTRTSMKQMHQLESVFFVSNLPALSKAHLQFFNELIGGDPVIRTTSWSKEMIERQAALRAQENFELAQKAWSVVAKGKLPNGELSSVEKRAEKAEKEVETLRAQLNDPQWHTSASQPQPMEFVDADTAIRLMQADQTISDLADVAVNLDQLYEQEKKEAARENELANDFAHELELERAKPKASKIALDTPTGTNTGQGFSEIKEGLTLAVKLRKPIFLSGPAGCGKSTMAKMIADELGLPFYAQNFSEGVLESSIFGMLVQVEGQQIEFAPCPLTDFFENGGVYCADEFPRGNDNVISSLNNALANGRLGVPQRVACRKNLSPTIKQHPDFVFIATGNTMGLGGDEMYSDNALNAATLSRFRLSMFSIDYDADYERGVVSNAVKANPNQGDDITLWANWLWKVRASIVKHGLLHVAGTRELKDGIDYIVAGEDPTDCQKKYLADWADDEIAQID